MQLMSSPSNLALALFPHLFDTRKAQAELRCTRPVCRRRLAKVWCPENIEQTSTAPSPPALTLHSDLLANDEVWVAPIPQSLFHAEARAN